jgi:hypothetical protein
MSQWRDARLQRALQEAPDADMMPSARARQAILAQARDAVAPARAAPWWKRFWQDMGSRQMPWNAAFATVVVATLVTVLWHDREVPDARTETAVTDRQAPAPAAAPAAVPAPDSVPAPTQAPAVAAKPPAVVPAPAGPAPQAANRRDDLLARKKQAADSVQATAPAEAPEAPAAAAAPPQTPAAPPAAEAKRERRAEAATGALRNDQGGALSKAAPREAEPSRPADRAVAESAPAQALPPVQSPAAPPPPAPAAAAAPQAKSAGPMFAPQPPVGAAASAGLSSQFDAAASVPATDTLLLAGEGRSAQLSASQATRLLELVNRLGREAQSSDPLREPVMLRIELRRQGQLIGLLELAGRQVRWTQWRAGERRTATAQPDDAQLQALRDEFRRLIER